VLDEGLKSREEDGEREMKLEKEGGCTEEM
jgi:hypothetical protein